MTWQSYDMNQRDGELLPDHPKPNTAENVPRDTGPDSAPSSGEVPRDDAANPTFGTTEGTLGDERSASEPEGEDPSARSDPRSGRDAASPKWQLLRHKRGVAAWTGAVTAGLIGALLVTPVQSLITNTRNTVNPPEYVSTSVTLGPEKVQFLPAYADDPIVKARCMSSGGRTTLKGALFELPEFLH